GIFEATRNEYFFPFVEDHLINSSVTPPATYAAYEEFRQSYIFDNTIFISVLNFAAMLGIFLIMRDAWISGREEPKRQLHAVFIHWGLLWVLFMYVSLIIFNYITGIFID